MEKVVDTRVFQEYFKGIRTKFLTGDYTEGTYRTPFENFIESLNNNFHLTQEPKRVQKLGAPDFKSYRKGAKIGYIETKDLGKNLDNELESEQLKKYKESINNLILTNYSRFILIRDSHKIFDINLFNLSDLDKLKFVISDDKIEEFLKLIKTFFDYKSPTIKSAKELAEALSKKARLLKDLAKEQLEEDLSKVNSGKPSSVYDFYKGLEELIKDITIDDCADAYAQTITYGLFLAKTNCAGILSRDTAASYIPRSIGVIKRIFVNIAGDALPSNLSWIVDEIIDVLNASDMKSILSEIDFRGKKDRDPFTFFYEDFLRLYDPKKRKHLGVFYTPRPVVNFIVKSIEQILKNDFNKLNGFGEDDVTVLDPAVGTGTFLWLVYLRTIVDLKERGLGGLIKSKIEKHILKDFYGFEILMTPYIIAHLKLTTVINKWFYKFKEYDRIQVYLTNTLEPFETHALMPFFREITEESKIANELKLEKPILVVIGNPPYSVSSSNKSKWIMEKMQDYKKDLNERNIQPLDDDYIKFIRFAQWKIEQNKQGIVGYITNNSYLDGIIHRQMRKSLLDSFDRIYILNLHGSSRREEPTEKKDENVFDIQQGVAIALFVKNDKFKDKKVFYADLYGKREEKYHWLDRNRINTVKWQELKPEEPYYFLVPKDLSLQEEYEKFWKMTEIFEKYSSGIETRKDYLTTDISRDCLKDRVLQFANPKITNEFLMSTYHIKKSRDWILSEVRKVLFEKGFDPNLLIKYGYRPFDDRWIYFEDKFIAYPFRKIFNQGQQNLYITTQRNTTTSWKHAIVNQYVVDKHCTGELSYSFPLYIYNENKEKSHQKILTGEVIESKLGKQLNFTQDFIEFIEEQYPNQKITPEDILSYIYAMLHSPTYRQKFNEFLKIDFPRIPFVKDFKVFKQLSEIGKELVNLHLMKTKLKTSTKFGVQGPNVIKFVRCKDNKVYINKDQFFDGVSEEVWNFYIGGYQVLDKWLKSRKNRELSSNEIEHFLQVVEIIKRTMGYMEEIDKINLSI